MEALMSDGGKEAVSADEAVMGAAEVRRLEEQVRELERLLGRKTLEVEILKEALERARAKKTLLSRSPVQRLHLRRPQDDRDRASAEP
jgi:transposase